jgi:putative heme-binding domain-containing protein
VTREVFEALLATNDLLAGTTRKPKDETSGEEYIAQIVRDATQPAAIRAVALRMLRPDHPALSAAHLRQFLMQPDKNLRWEAARTLALQSDGLSQEELRRLAGDRDAEPALRAEAVMGLAQSAPSSTATRRLLMSLLDEPQLRRDVLRSLRETADKNDVGAAVLGWWERLSRDTSILQADRQELAAQLLLTFRSGANNKLGKPFEGLATLAGPRPRDEAGWRAALAGDGDPVAGERVFFHVRGPRCYVCHRVDGRGGVIGPDLSNVGRVLSRDKLIESILAPSKEIAPQYVTWHIATRDGKVRMGVIVDEGPHSTITIADAQGKLEVVHRTAIEERHALSTSIMPENLHELMTRREFQDLLAFLARRDE